MTDRSYAPPWELPQMERRGQQSNGNDHDRSMASMVTIAKTDKQEQHALLLQSTVQIPWDHKSSTSSNCSSDNGVQGHDVQGSVAVVPLHIDHKLQKEKREQEPQEEGGQRMHSRGQIDQNTGYEVAAYAPPVEPISSHTTTDGYHSHDNRFAHVHTSGRTESSSHQQQRHHYFQSQYCSACRSRNLNDSRQQQQLKLGAIFQGIIFHFRRVKKEDQEQYGYRTDLDGLVRLLQDRGGICVIDSGSHGSSNIRNVRQGEQEMGTRDMPVVVVVSSKEAAKLIAETASGRSIAPLWWQKDEEINSSRTTFSTSPIVVREEYVKDCLEAGYLLPPSEQYLAFSMGNTSTIIPNTSRHNQGTASPVELDIPTPAPPYHRSRYYPPYPYRRHQMTHFSSHAYAHQFSSPYSPLFFRRGDGTQYRSLESMAEIAALELEERERDTDSNCMPETDAPVGNTKKRNRKRKRKSIPDNASDDNINNRTRRKRKNSASDGGDDSSSDERQSEDEAEYSDSEVIDCICGFDGEEGMMICCDECMSWLHCKCVGIHHEEDVPEQYVCIRCVEAFARIQTEQVVANQHEYFVA